MNVKMIGLFLALLLAFEVAGASEPNDGRAKDVFGIAGAIIGTGAGATLGAPAGAAGTGAGGAAGGLAGQAAGEAIGSAVDRHAEDLKKSYNAAEDPRYDPRTLFDY